MTEDRIKEAMRLVANVVMANSLFVTEQVTDSTLISQARAELEDYLRTIKPMQVMNLELLKLVKRAEDFFNGPTAWTQEQEDLLALSLAEAVTRVESTT